MITFFCENYDLILLINGATIHHAKEMMYMRRFDFNLREELFNRIKLMADFYNIPVSKMMIQLLEIGYIEMLKMSNLEVYDNK